MDTFADICHKNVLNFYTSHCFSGIREHLFFEALSNKCFRLLTKHGTTIRTGITCKKIPCYIRDSSCRWFFLKKAKIF